MIGGVPDGQSSIVITVNAANQEANQSIQFLAGGPVQYSLNTGVIGGHGSIEPTGGTYNEGAQVLLTATPDKGYKVAAWTGIDEGSAVDNLTGAIVTMTQDKIVTVEFEEIPGGMYTLSTQVQGNGILTVYPEDPYSMYAEGTVVSLIAVPDTGYRVKSWSGTGNAPSTGSATNTVTMTEDKMVTVEFEVAFTIGGAVYADMENPLTSGVAGVTIIISNNDQTFTTTTNGPQGIWQIDNLPQGTYTITPSMP